MAVTKLGSNQYGSGSVDATAIASTSVTPAAYTNLSATIDADGRVTAASSGTAVPTRAANEVPSGSINGSNPTFTLAHTPIAGTEEVFLNGIHLFPGAGNDYTISSATLTMLTTAIPVTGDRLTVSYNY